MRVSEPDTAAIRAECTDPDNHHAMVCRVLCDALDAARAVQLDVNHEWQRRAEAAEVERDEALDYNRACNEMREQHKARADAAEAERDGWRELAVTHEADAHRAEARIAAALAIRGRLTSDGVVLDAEAVRRALTRDTDV